MQNSNTQVAKGLGSISDKLLESREPLVLKLIIKAYRKMCEEKRYPAKRDEVWFSVILKSCIEKICREYSMATGHQWTVERENLNDNELIRLGQADPNAAPRIDIVITCWKGFKRRTKFPFESKLISEDNSTLINYYIKKGLIDRYLNQEKDYAAGQLWGGMIGYILQGSHTTIVDKLNKQIDRQIKHPDDHLFIGRPIEGFEAIYKSQHQHPDDIGILKIMHLFLAFLLVQETTEEE